ncbi:MAG: glycerol-3-phosphate 1-O-acyltransferase PlsY [Proteobacteria bacterium]|nr:glycerol-3-phosphate 1-O-acyltransferase PlsY [Pseudomonadota bacterium]
MNTIVFNITDCLVLSVGTVGGYLLGSISSAILICWLFRLPDPRFAGSKNPGTTNVLRLGGKFPAALTLLCDAVKGALPLMLAKCATQNPWVLSVILLTPVLGHMYPVFFHFKGGKGVATTIGGLLALSAPLCGIFLLTWIGVFILTGYSSLSALIAIICMPGWSWIMLDHRYIPALVLLALLIILKHHENIRRLLAGEESKLSFKSKNRQNS